MTVAPAMIRPRLDGVHLRVRGLTANKSFVVYRATDIGWVPAARGEAGAGPSNDAAEVVWLVPPGKDLAGCVEPRHQVGNGEGLGSLTVVDEEGLYVPSDPSCGENETRTYELFTPSAGDATGPLSAARAALQGIRQADEIQLAGYPTQTPPIVRIVRAGTTVGAVYFAVDGAGALLACIGSGLTPVA